MRKSMPRKGDCRNKRHSARRLRQMYFLRTMRQRLSHARTGTHRIRHCIKTAERLCQARFPLRKRVFLYAAETRSVRAVIKGVDAESVQIDCKMHVVQKACHR